MFVTLNMLNCVRRESYRLGPLVLNRFFLNNRIIYPLNNQRVNFQGCQRNFSLQTTIDSIVITQTGLFKALSESTPVEYCQKLLLTIHDVSGLPWWASITCTTILLRGCVTVPLAVYQQYILAKLEHIKLEMDDIAKELKKETAVAIKIYNWEEKTARIAYKISIRKQWKTLIERDNCHPFKTTLLVFFQIPLWISLSVGLRNLVYMLPNQDFNSQLIFAELCVGGFGWVPNLSEVDSSLILPLCFGLSNLAIVEIQILSKMRDSSTLQKYITNFFRGLSLMMIPISAAVPSCLVLYWTTSSVFGLVQNLVLMSPKVRRTCHIPKTPSELEQPYQHLKKGIKQRLRFLVSIFKVS